MPDSSPGLAILLIVLGLAIGLWQLAVLTNFRGYRDSHARRTLRTMRADGAAARKFATITQIVVASMFVAAAAGMIVLGVIGLAG